MSVDTKDLKDDKLVVKESSQELGNNQEESIGDEPPKQYDEVRDEGFEMFQKGGLNDEVDPV